MSIKYKTIARKNLQRPADPVKYYAIAGASGKRSKKINIRILFLILTLNCYAYPQVFDFQAHFEGTCQSVEFNNDYAYFNSGPNINILDISNPEEVILVNSFHTGYHFPVDINYSNGYLFICSGVKGFIIYDVRDPLQPEFISWVNWPSCQYGYESMIKDSLILIDEGFKSSISIFNIADLFNPVFLSRIDFPVNVYGAYAFYKNMLYGFEISENTNWDYYLRGYNIAHPSNPLLACELKLYEWPGLRPNDMIVHDKDLLVAFQDTVKVFDISSTDTIIYKSSFTLPFYVNKMQIYGDTLFVYSESEGILLVNVWDVLNPSIVGLNEQVNPIDKFLFQEDRLITALGYKGFELVDIDELSNPSRLFECKKTDNVLSIEIQDDIAYMGMDERGLQLVDISNPLAPVDLGNIDSIKRIRKIEYYPGYLFCGLDNEYNKIHVIDVNDPLNPVKVNEILGSFLIDYKIANNTLYVISNEWLKLFDLTNPATPTEAENYQIGGHRIAVDSNLIVMTYAATLKTYRIETNNSLVFCDEIVLGEYPSFHPMELIIDFPYLNIGAHQGAMVVELDDDYNVTICDKIILGGYSSSTNAMSSDKNFIYLGTWFNGADQIVIIDIRDPYDLRLFQSINGHCMDFGLKQKMVFTCESQNGYSIFGDIAVNIFHPTHEKVQHEFLAFPNPFKDHLIIKFNDAISNNSTFKIYNLNSQLIAGYDVSGKKRIEINTETFENGIFILELFNNNQISSRKAIKVN